MGVPEPGLPTNCEWKKTLERERESERERETEGGREGGRERLNSLFVCGVCRFDVCQDLPAV